MAYRIAIATSDGNSIDGHFGSAPSFRIYEVTGEKIKTVEDRAIIGTANTPEAAACGSPEAAACNSSEGCGNGGCGHGHGGCGGGLSLELSRRIEQLSDCRSVVCRKIGFQAHKTLERRAVSGFEVDTTVEEALRKITFYFGRIDRIHRYAV